MVKSIFKILIVACGLILSACTKGFDEIDIETSSDKGMALTFDFTPEDAFTLTSSSDTRATTETVVENKLLNIWILLFDEDGNRIDPEGLIEFNTDIDNEEDDDVIEYPDGEDQYYYLDDDGEEQLRQAYYIDDNGDPQLRQGKFYTETGDNGIYTDEIYGSTRISSYESKQTIYVNKALSAKIRSIRAVANTMTTNKYFMSENCPDLDTYDEICFELKDNAYRESDMWNEFEGTCYLRMVGNWDGIIPDTGLDFNIAILAKPLAAKVTVNYECIDEIVTDGSGRVPSTIDVTSVQITRVPKKCYYRDVEDDPESHNHEAYTSYQPRLVYDENYLNDKDGEVSFYVPQNMRGTAGSSSEEVTPEERETMSPESLKTLYHAQDATCVIITAFYKYWDEELQSMEKKYVYIQLYPGDNNYDNYDVKLRHEYHMNCTITADATSVKWDTDYRVTLYEVLPEGAIVHYEFDPDNKLRNSAYDKFGELLGGYPREGEATYNEYIDNVTRTKYSGNSPLGYYNTTDEDGNEYEYDDARVYDLNIDGLDDYYDRYIYGFDGTTNVITHTDESNNYAYKPFLRNLATANNEYDNDDKSAETYNPWYPSKKHPEIFDCTLLKDNFKRYTDTSLTAGYTSGTLDYYPANNYINSSFLQLSTGWGAGLDPHKQIFTIVFIGSVGVNSQMDGKRGVYYGNSIEWNKRWYFYRFVRTDRVDNVTYGYGSRQTESIDALVADDYQNVQSYDVCNIGWRKVYYNNVDVDAIQAEFTVDKDKDGSSAISKTRPSTTDFIFDAPISIFGHTSGDNKDDAIDGKLRLFLIYDRELDLDDIDQIRRYAALKGLLLYGVEDYSGFDVNVTDPTVGPAWDTEVKWNTGVDEEGGDVTFGTAPSVD